MASTYVRQISVSDGDIEPHELSINNMQQQHAKILTHAVFKTLSTLAARLFYAHINDGAPLKSVVEDIADNASWIYPM